MRIVRIKIRKCRVCGCTQYHACPGGCYWVEKDLCSRCAAEIASECGKSYTGGKVMDTEQRAAYEWAKNQNYTSVAARYSKLLTEAIDELQDNTEKLAKENNTLKKALKNVVYRTAQEPKRRKELYEGLIEEAQRQAQEQEQEQSEKEKFI